jgi:hypothetical protein
MSTFRISTRSICTFRALQPYTKVSYLRPASRVTLKQSRHFSAANSCKMPENLTQGEVNSQTDPSVAKQYDNDTPKEEQIQDLFKLIDGNKVSMLNTYRNGVGQSHMQPFKAPRAFSQTCAYKHRAGRQVNGRLKTLRSRYLVPRQRAFTKDEGPGL